MPFSFVIAEYLVDQGADVNVMIDFGNRTAVHMACMLPDRLEMLKLLVTRGKADIKLTTESHQTLLHLAIHSFLHYDMRYADFLMPYYHPAVFPPGHRLASGDSTRDIPRDIHPGMLTPSHLYETLLQTLVDDNPDPEREDVREARVALLLETGTNPTYFSPPCASPSPYLMPPYASSKPLKCRNNEKVYNMIQDIATTPERKTLLEKLRVLNTTAHVLTGVVTNQGPHPGLRAACWAAVPRCLRERVRISRPLLVLHLLDSTVSHPWLTFKIAEKSVETERFLAVLRFVTATGELEKDAGAEGREAWPLLPHELFNEVRGMLELRWDYMVLQAEWETGMGGNIGGYDELRGQHQRESDERLEAFDSWYFRDDGWTEEGEEGAIAREEEGEVESLAESLAVF